MKSMRRFTRKIATLLQNPSSFFLVFGLAIGMLFVVIIPPFQVPDEQVHFYKAYSISELNFIQDNMGATASGASIPTALSEYAGVTMRNDLTNNTSTRYTRDTITQSLKIKVNRSERIDGSFVNLATYSPVAYFPQVVGIWVASIFSDRVAVMFYAARLFNLLFYIGVVYCALRLAKRSTWALVLVALS